MPLSFCAHTRVAYVDAHDISESSGEGTTSRRHTIEDLGPETLKPPDVCAEDLHNPGGAPSAANAAVVAAKGTASLGIIGATEGVATAKAQA